MANSSGQIFPAKCCRASSDDNGAHVWQQFTAVAAWLGLRPHSQGGCIIVTGFRGCLSSKTISCRKSQMQSPPCQHPLLQPIYAQANPRTSSGASFCLTVTSSFPFSLLLLLTFDFCSCRFFRSFGPTWIFWVG